MCTRAHTGSDSSLAVPSEMTGQLISHPEPHVLLCKTQMSLLHRPAVTVSEDSVGPMSPQLLRPVNTPRQWQRVLRGQVGVLVAGEAREAQRAQTGSLAVGGSVQPRGRCCITSMSQRPLLFVILLRWRVGGSPLSYPFFSSPWGTLAREAEGII